MLDLHTIPTIGSVLDFILVKSLNARDLSITASHRRELQGVSRFRAILKVPEEDQPLLTQWYLFNSADQLFHRAPYTLSWYNARRNSEHRSPEYRIYYPRTLDLDHCVPGDVLVTIRWRPEIFAGGPVEVFVFRRDSEKLARILELLNLKSLSQTNNLPTSSFDGATLELAQTLDASARQLFEEIRPGFRRRLAAWTCSRIEGDERYNHFDETALRRLARSATREPAILGGKDNLAVGAYWSEAFAFLDQTQFATTPAFESIDKHSGLLDRLKIVGRRINQFRHQLHVAWAEETLKLQNRKITKTQILSPSLTKLTHEVARLPIFSMTSDVQVLLVADNLTKNNVPGMSFGLLAEECDALWYFGDRLTDQQRRAIHSNSDWISTVP